MRRCKRSWVWGSGFKLKVSSLGFGLRVENFTGCRILGATGEGPGVWGLSLIVELGSPI